MKKDTGYNKSISEEAFKDPNFTIKDYYFTYDKEATDRKLDILKKRNCSFNMEKLRKKMNE